MRRVNLRHEDESGKVRRRSLPCGKSDEDLYVGTGTITLSSPGINASGTFVESMDMEFTPVSTTGELRPFTVVADPGYTDLVFEDGVTVEATT